MRQVRFWAVESGGEAMYMFISGVYRMGGAAPIGDEAWAYLSAHRGDFEAAVGSPMPKEQRAVPAWASANRTAIWQSLYGSTRPPR